MVQKDVTTRHICLHQHRWPGRDERGLAAATTGHRSGHHDGAAGHVAVPLCSSKGMDGGRSRRTAADVSITAGGTAGPLALTLQTGLSLDQVTFFTMTSSKIPAQGYFFNPALVRGGEREEAQLPSH